MFAEDPLDYFELCEIQQDVVDETIDCLWKISPAF
jgi:hypothetical protein